MRRIFSYLELVLFVFAIFSIDTLQGAKKKRFSSRVYAERPKEKDISYTPNSTEIDLFERLLDSNLNQLFANTNDSMAIGTKEKVTAEINNYNRRYYGVVTTESAKMMIVEFLHPDNRFFNERWQDSTWIPNEKNYKFFSVHFYTEDNDNMMFNLQFDKYCP